MASISAQTENGVAECTFTRPASVSKGGLTFDLTTDNFRLIQAIGTIEQSGKNQTVAGCIIVSDYR